MKFGGSAFLLALSLVQFGFADEHKISHCTGFSTIPTEMTTGECQAGICEVGFLPQNIVSTVSCDDGQSFPVSANIQNTSFQQTCNSGVMSGTVETFWSNIRWEGICPKGELYGSTSNATNITTYFGTCMNNGFFQAQLQGAAFGITVECSY